MLRGAGFRALRMTTLWAPGLTRPTAVEGRVLANAVQAARENGIRVYLSVFAARPRDAPTTRPAAASSRPSPLRSSAACRRCAT